MSKCTDSSTIRLNIFQLSEPIRQSLSAAPYSSPPSNPDISIKAHLQTLLENPTIQSFALCCAALASAPESTSTHLTWVPRSLSVSAESAIKRLAEFVHSDYSEEDSTQAKCSTKVCDFEKRLVLDWIPEVLPLLKGSIKESAIDASDDVDFASRSRVPVPYAIVAANQLRWLVTQVDAEHMGKLCPLVIPCALTCLDHWSPEIKDQGMISFIHLAQNVKASDIGGYADVILDACCQNVACEDDLWLHLVNMSILLVTLTQQSNPRSSWYEKLTTEMLNHLERQPRNKQRRIAWLRHCDPLFKGLGLVLLSHFSRLFPLFFKWLHADEDETVLLVLKRIITVIRLTWIRNSPHIERLVDELIILYKDAALKVAREDIRSLVLQLLTLIRVSRGPQFHETWDKYTEDPNLKDLLPSLMERDPAMVNISS